MFLGIAARSAVQVTLRLPPSLVLAWQMTRHYDAALALTAAPFSNALLNPFGPFLPSEKCGKEVEKRMTSSNDSSEEGTHLHRLYVAGIPKWCTEPSLQQLFDQVEGALGQHDKKGTCFKAKRRLFCYVCPLIFCSVQQFINDIQSIIYCVVPLLRAQLFSHSIRKTRYVAGEG